MNKGAVILVVILMSSNVFLLSKTVSAQNPLFTEDFETGSNGWMYKDGALSFAGTQQSVVYEGVSAYKMTGAIDSSGAYAGEYQYALNIPVTPTTKFFFAYNFPSKNVAYIGYYLTFSTGKMGYYISLFSGSFINISVTYLLQYRNEAVNTWYSHTANVYDNYRKAFGSVPSGLSITGISMMMGDPYYTHKTQTAYFDGVSIAPDSSQYKEDFETGSDGWKYTDGALSFAGTQQTVVYEGTSAYKMTGAIDSSGAYAGNYRCALSIPVTPNTQFSFAYRFPGKNVAYVGYYLTFSTGKMGYYISLFSGSFINISVTYLLQYRNEAVNTWYFHTANVYDNYRRAFGSVPSDLRITKISMMMGDPYYTHKTQTAYFDGISIAPASKFIEDFETGYDGWQKITGNFQYAGTQTQIKYQGTSAFKMISSRESSSGYAGQYSYPVDIAVTPGKQFTFSYYFPTKSVSYVGYLLHFNNGKEAYYISLFSGYFINNTAYYLCQYPNEQINLWHTHSHNVYQNYINAFRNIPSNLKITSISMIMGDPYFTNQLQTAYFDMLTIS